MGRGPACGREPACRAAAGSCSRPGAPGPGEGERPLARSMSFSDSSATFLLNEVNARAPPHSRQGRRPIFGGDCSDREGDQEGEVLGDWVERRVRKEGTARAANF